MSWLSSFPNWSLWLVTIGSSALIAVLAFVATAGWAELSTRSVRTELEAAESQRQHNARKAIVKALATELLINRAQFFKPAFADATKEELSRYAVYPVLQSDAVAAAIASGLFTETKDTELLSTLFFLIAAINVYNNEAKLTQDRLNIHTIIPDTELARQRIGDTRDALNRSKGVATVQASLGDLKAFLDDEGVDWKSAKLDLGP
ncbi:hypothetical protein [Candidatus Nitrospira salsa]